MKIYGYYVNNNLTCEIMNLLIWVCLTQAIWPKALALYHLRSFEVFKPPKALRNDSYFGYSVTYYPEIKQLVISAPREDNIGEVYTCEIDKRSCTPIVHNITRVSADYPHDYWFGATVKSGPDFVIMCAPRYTEKVYSFQDFGTFGKCYKMHKDRRLEVMKSISQTMRVNESPGLFEMTMDSFGWSIDVAFDDSIIVGGPGMFTGRAMVFQPHKPTPTFMRKTKFTPTFNFGYDVSSGTFINDQLSYAVSSTYGKKGFGDVTFFKEVTRQTQLLKTEDEGIVGSMYGAVLCSAQLYSKRSDLLVGSPTYAQGSAYNLGAVYVYISVTKGKAPQYKRKIVGPSEGSYFGGSIISLGDFNGDGKDEIAVGAPFENNGRGAVYLYSGADLISEKTEKTLTCLQRIEPSDPVASDLVHHQSFGLSLTTLLDYDDNGCKELAIGAPYSDAVVLFRCMASITVKTTSKFPNLQNRAGKTDFKFKVCLSAEYPLKPRNILARIATTVEMSHTDAKLTTADKTGTLTFETSLHEKLPEYCTDIPFVLPLDGNYEMEIGIKISSVLMEDPMKSDKFDEKRVILSDRSVLTVQDSVWAAECSGDKECVPKLSIAKSSLSFGHEYIIGSSKTEELDLAILNAGEVAYDACLRVRIVGAPVFNTPNSCVREPATNGDRLQCAPTKPLRANKTWTTGPIVLEMTHLTNLNRNITVDLQLFNRCKGNSSKNHTIVAPLEGDPTGIVVKGETDIGAIVNMTKEEILYDGKQMQHVYTIVNHGLTNWVELSSLVVLQKKTFIKYNNPNTVYVSMSNSYRDCEQVSSDTERMSYICAIDSLPAKLETIKIVVPMYITPGTVDHILEDNTELLSSNFALIFNGYPNISQSIFTTLRLKDAAVPLWVILLAALVGLFIIVIIAFALYECGFLRRKKRRDLKNLRASVRRQTIMRHSMRQSRAEDREQIMGETAKDEDIILSCPEKDTSTHK